MDTPVHRGATPARVVALAIIAIMVVGLAGLRLATDAVPVPVPDGAEEGDLTLEPCTYAGEDGDYPADCGTLVVPETRGDPESRLIALPVMRIRATSEDPKEPVFFLTGGPGQSNMQLDIANRYVEHRDVVLVGYRGIDGSVRLDCPEVESALKHSTDVLGDEFFEAYADGYRSCAGRLTDDGFDLASYGLAQQVDDMEDARAALGYHRINLLSESAGTRTAIIYSWRHPERIHRSVMLAVNPPGAFLLDPATTDEQIDRYADLCSQDSGCSERTDDLAASLEQVAAELPDRWLFLPIKEGNVRTVSVFGLFESTSAGTMTPAPVTLDAWLSAAEGDPSGFWFASVLGDLMFPELFVRGQYTAAAMLDAQAARDYFAGGFEDDSNLGYAATAFSWGGGRLADSWPAAPDETEYREVRSSEVPTLIISGELDVATPPQVAEERLLPYLSKGQQVVLPGFGHTVTLLMEQPAAGSRLINTFFDSGRVDDSLYVRPSIDFTPSTTFGAVARTALAVMLAGAALTVLSLLLMARRLRRKGRIAPRSSVLLRSIHPLLLGLGGWFLGVLVVLSTMPGVRVGNELVVVLSVGVPVGLGVGLAWVDRDRSATTTTTGLAMAAGLALVGAWLGFEASEGLPALVTAIVGATAAANLGLLALDISRSRRSLGPSPSAEGASEASPPRAFDPDGDESTLDSVGVDVKE